MYRIMRRETQNNGSLFQFVLSQIPRELHRKVRHKCRSVRHFVDFEQYLHAL
jgi:hypothetical protein